MQRSESFTKTFIQDTYIERFPQHALATNNLMYGVHMYKAEIALRMAIVQHNYKHSLCWLVYDVDRECAAIDWDDCRTPPPNIIAINRGNGHAHFFYGLKQPVHNYAGASQKALRYLGSIDIALTEKLNADPGYTKLLSKNPINTRWETIYLKTSLYDLDELADWLDLNKYCDKRKRLPDVGYGRNCTLFERLRVWAYRERRQPYLSAEFYHAAVLNHGLVLNQEFNPPLPHSEVRATAKSVARWTWNRMSKEGFIVYQREMGKRSGIKRKQKSLELRERIIETKQQCPTLVRGEIAALVGVTRRTVRKHLNSLR